MKKYGVLKGEATKSQEAAREHYHIKISLSMI
jgi:hypothetical protein